MMKNKTVKTAHFFLPHNCHTAEAGGKPEKNHEKASLRIELNRLINWIKTNEDEQVRTSWNKFAHVGSRLAEFSA